jgi:hypothetical protein
MKTLQKLLLAASVGLLCWPAAAQYQVVFDFEAPTYTAGPLVGQDGWYELANNGGTAVVITTDNGPSGAGSQCVEMSTIGGSGDARIWVERAYADAIANGGRLVTLRYDIRRVTWESPEDFRCRIPGGTMAHWWDNWSQWWGYVDIHENLGGWDSFNWPVNDDAWHTIEWTLYYGDQGAGEYGMLLTLSFDGDVNPFINRRFMGLSDPQIVDTVYLRLDEAYWNQQYDDILYIDNLVVRGEDPPSAVPVADAGPDVTQDPGSWDGVELDASGSYDDGEIVMYRWSTVGALIYQGPDAVVQVDLGPGVYDLMLEVVDDDGLRGVDTAVYTIGERPPILDQVAGPWGIKNGDIFGTNASDQLPCDTSVGEFEVLDVAYVSGPWDGLPGHGNGDVVFDRFGNLYWVSWNRLLESYTKDLQLRWRGHDGEVEKQLGVSGPGWSIDNGSWIAGIRYIYVVGAGNDDGSVPYGEPKVYAFEKSTGQLVWETGLTGEDWSHADPRPKVTLYNDKLYIVGENIVEHVLIHQVDATTGNHDWASDCYVEMQYNELNNPGSVAFVPDAYGPGFHGLFFNQMSDTTVGGFDGYADIVAIKINPAVGATVVWGPAQNIDGPGLERSNPIYSATTGLIYTPSLEDDVWDHSLYAWRPSGTPSPLVATYTTGEFVGHGWRYNFALDFDGVTIHAPGEWDTIRSYTDNGDGTFDYVYRDLGGFWETGWGFGHQGCLLQDQNGDSIYFTVNESNTDPNEVDRVASRVWAINLSEELPDPNEPTVAPIATWTCQEWNEDLEDWDYSWPYYGPTPGPDGSLYIFQQRGWDYQRIVRLRLVPSAPVCPGDVDGDGDTDLNDLAALLAAYGSFVGQPNYNPAADFDDDGDVDLTDLAFLLADYGCLP